MQEVTGSTLRDTRLLRAARVCPLPRLACVYGDMAYTLHWSTPPLLILAACAVWVWCQHLSIAYLRYRSRRSLQRVARRMLDLSPEQWHREFRCWMQTAPETMLEIRREMLRLQRQRDGQIHGP
jgi:hypothetical protein